MNVKLTDTHKAFLKWGLVLLLTVALGFLGVRYPLPEPPTFDAPITLGTTHFTNVSAEDITATDDLAVSDDAAITDQLTGADIVASDDVTATDSLVAEEALIDGVSDAVRLTIQGHSTQTSNLLVLETSAGTDVITATNAGNLYVSDITAGDDLIVVDDTTLTGLLYPGFADETITDGEVLTPTVTVYALDSAAAVTMTLAASAAEGQLLILVCDDANTITIDDTNVRTTDGAAATCGQYDVLGWIYQDSEWLHLFKSTNS